MNNASDALSKMVPSKTPDEIKKGLKCFQHIKNHECNDLCIGEECDLYMGSYPITENASDALAYIEQLEAQIPKWISVEERLPEDDVNVLVCAIGNNGQSVVEMTCYTHRMYGYNIEGWRPPWQYFFDTYKVTHWMPLPEMPKEE